MCTVIYCSISHWPNCCSNITIFEPWKGYPGQTVVPYICENIWIFTLSYFNATYQGPDMEAKEDCLQDLKDFDNILNEVDNENPLKCSICDKILSSKGNLKLHKRVHTGEKPFQCSKCDFRCTNSGNLKHHELIHTEEKLFACLTCGMKFSRQFTLSSYEKVHQRKTIQL